MTVIIGDLSYNFPGSELDKINLQHLGLLGFDVFVVAVRFHIVPTEPLELIGKFEILHLRLK